MSYQPSAELDGITYTATPAAVALATAKYRGTGTDRLRRIIAEACGPVPFRMTRRQLLIITADLESFTPAELAAAELAELDREPAEPAEPEQPVLTDEDRRRVAAAVADRDAAHELEAAADRIAGIPAAAEHVARMRAEAADLLAAAHDAMTPDEFEAYLDELAAGEKAAAQ